VDLPRWLEFSLGSTPRIMPLASTQLSLYGTNNQLPSGLFVASSRTLRTRYRRR
jgi:hypothetical protein